MRRKSQTRALAILGITLFLTMSGSVAYYVTSETAHNIVSTGGVSIKLYDQADPEGITPFNDLENISAGITYSKIPYVENISIEPVWVRAKLTLKKKTGDTETIIDDISTLMELGEIGSSWIKADDGFYYYNQSLALEQKTEPILRTVRLKEEASEENTTYTFTVLTEATQVAHNGTSAITASWTENGGE
ncbi:hypothetical protein IKF63_01715 [Candidatus Saccharibacteria bacterium]|nr:hypothetical protein [Candidatus Saccharibacteria bacterium]